MYGSRKLYVASLETAHINIFLTTGRFIVGLIKKVNTWRLLAIFFLFLSLYVSLPASL